MLSSSCRGNNISENKIKKEADSSLLLIESSATASLNILPFIQVAFSPDCQNSLYSLINDKASPCPLEVVDEQEGAEFFPFSGKQSCSAEIQPKGVCKAPLMKARLMYSKILKGISSAKITPNPQKGTWAGKRTLEEELVLTSTSEPRRRRYQPRPSCCSERGCVPANTVVTLGPPS